MPSYDPYLITNSELFSFPSHPIPLIVSRPFKPSLPTFLNFLEDLFFIDFIGLVVLSWIKTLSKEQSYSVADPPACKLEI